MVIVDGEKRLGRGILVFLMYNVIHVGKNGFWSGRGSWSWQGKGKREKGSKGALAPRALLLATQRTPQ